MSGVISPASSRNVDRPVVSIIIVTWNSADRVGACLGSLETHADRRATDVVLVDNASSDGTAELVRESFPWVRVVENRANVGFPRAVNQGVRMSSGRFVLLLNPDACLSSDTLSSLQRVFDDLPDAGAVGPHIVRTSGETDDFAARAFPSLGNAVLRWSGIRRLAPHSRWLGRETIRVDGREPNPVPCLTGAVLMVPRALIEEVGLLDETIPMYLEDLELCRRIHAHGRRVYFDPGTTVVHEGGASTAKSRHRAFLRATENGHAPWLFIRRWQGTWASRAFVAAVAVGAALRALWHGSRALLLRMTGRDASERLVAAKDNVALLRWACGSKEAFQRRLRLLFTDHASGGRGGDLDGEAALARVGTST